MHQGASFNAPWGTSLKVMTVIAVLILLSVPVLGLVTGPGGSIFWKINMLVLPLSILAIAVFFMIRGYQLTEDTLLVQRLGWKSRIDLSGLVSAEADPQAMSKSIRTFGNGGLFCFAGAFRNRKLGGYRAFATDLKSAVVLRFEKKVIVVTPENPAYFVSRIKELRNLKS